MRLHIRHRIPPRQAVVPSQIHFFASISASISLFVVFRQETVPSAGLVYFFPSIGGWKEQRIGPFVSVVDAGFDHLHQPIGTGTHGTANRRFRGRHGRSGRSAAVSRGSVLGTESVRIPGIGIPAIATPPGLRVIKRHVVAVVIAVDEAIVTQDAGFVALTGPTHPDDVVAPKGMLAHPPRDGRAEGGDGEVRGEGGGVARQRRVVVGMGGRGRGKGGFECRMFVGVRAAAMVVAPVVVVVVVVLVVLIVVSFVDVAHAHGGGHRTR
mmetsp:Transcript_19112/g.40059  ORF Transcript_19112/g.40059 Transcript_19112/m.40059 type:complete len:267 (-) Transcript_19112:528-1328(-)